MANLDRIVNVQISLNTTAIKEQTFSDLLVLAAHTLSVNRVLIVTQADELLELGLPTTDPLYMAVRDAFKQIPTLNRIYVGRRQVDEASITVTAAAEVDYSITLNWRDAQGAVQTATATYAGLAADDTSDIATALATAINNTAAPVTALATGAAVSVDADVAGAAFALAVDGNLVINASTTSESPSVALTECRAENGDWYGVSLASRAEADILDAAEWVEANQKLQGVASGDPGIIDAGLNTDLASKLKAKNYFRTACWYHALAASEWLDTAVAANRFTFYPGAETWANVKLAGITADNLREGQAQAAFNKNANTFEPFRNFAITQSGKVAAGEWIDVIRFRDWLAEQIKVAVVSALINVKGQLGKVPYTDGGIQIVTNAMRGVLDLGVARGGIAPEEVDEDGRKIPSYTVTAPLSANVPFNDKANRILRDVYFTARLAGAIHAVEIKGNLTYEL
ncbi:DUF3383 domain-containing protein [Bordetella petrii]|uniref:Bacteriophage protein n=1 Tax=Bordetella petrii (strain ATCC BAA-461 / DSM 12804 / CCUG 43448 / CIP 107267 / Se-1111R) TaxID=340100 RepID=A9I922_BORPD|nr:DUF3383 domain-containing protein [Bordetella petrii]CAP41319.1 hypothetical protein Bpet0987 [Bordetella petrii]